MRKITCVNSSGATIIFNDDSFSPFLLAHVEGLYETQNNVYVSENTMIDGGEYQGSVKKVRNIVITIMDLPNNVFNIKNRDILYSFFAKGKRGTLIFTENDISRKIEYYVEYIRRANTESRLITISLICPDPYFYDLADTEVKMADYIANFEFVHEFVSDGEELSYRSSETLKNIVNDSGTDEIGMTITLTAIGPVTNPSIAKVETGETMKIGYTGKELNMITDDKLIITTHINNKHVYLERDGVKEEINQFLTEDSTFIQIMQGNNNIGYSAESGYENLIVSIDYKFRYDGA